MKKLTICIPTYNRVSLLQDSLNSIITAINYAKIEVDIIISDNSSTDKTKEYCLSLINEYPFISYYLNDENVNELNFYIAITRAQTDYVWLFSDDDLMNFKSISIVNKALFSGNNLIIGNYDLYDSKLETEIKKNYFSIEKDLFYFDKNKLLMDYHLKLGFISCVIFEKKSFLKMPIEVFDKYRPYGFPFVYGLYSSFNDSLKAIVISDSILIQRGANNPADIKWWYKCFVEGSSKIFLELKHYGYNNKTIIKAQKNVFKEYVITDLIWRKNNNYNTIESIPYLYRNYKLFPHIIILSILIITTPKFIIKFLYSLKQKLS